MYFCLQPPLQQQFFTQDLPWENGVLKVKKLMPSDMAGKNKYKRPAAIYKKSRAAQIKASF